MTTQGASDDRRAARELIMDRVVREAPLAAARRPRVSRRRRGWFTRWFSIEAEAGVVRGVDDDARRGGASAGDVSPDETERGD